MEWIGLDWNVLDWIVLDEGIRQAVRFKAEHLEEFHSEAMLIFVDQ